MSTATFLIQQQSEQSQHSLTVTDLHTVACHTTNHSDMDVVTQHFECHVYNPATDFLLSVHTYVRTRKVDLECCALKALWSVNYFNIELDDKNL